jgi:pSer/pThr/pTyr-binding forkhead associated (FHA) protein
LTVDGDRVFISDLGSGNGVYVDGVRITEPTPLRVGSQISIGEQSLEVAEIQRTDVQLSISFREIEGPDVDKVYSVHVKEMTVGRGKAARIRFADATSTLSRLHARFDLKDGQIYVTDLGSKNGTYVDGELIDGPTPIQEGSVIKFGGVVCEVVAIETLR